MTVMSNNLKGTVWFHMNLLIHHPQAAKTKGQKEIDNYYVSHIKKTYNSRDSLVVTHPTTNRPACGLSTAERTGSPVFHTLWSYVLVFIAQGFLATPFGRATRGDSG